MEELIQQQAGEIQQVCLWTLRDRHQVVSVGVHNHTSCTNTTIALLQHLQSLQAYELQMSNLTHSLAKMEAALRQEQEEKVQMLYLSSLEPRLSSSFSSLAVSDEKLDESLGSRLLSVTLRASFTD